MSGRFVAEKGAIPAAGGENISAVYFSDSQRRWRSKSAKRKFRAALFEMGEPQKRLVCEERARCNEYLLRRARTQAAVESLARHPSPQISRAGRIFNPCPFYLTCSLPRLLPATVAGI